MSKLAGMITDLQSLNLSSDLILSIVAIAERHMTRAPAKEKAGGHLPADWQPSEVTIAKLRAKGIGDGLIRECLQDMRDWAEANANRSIARKLKWDAAFAGWVRREFKKQSIRKSFGPSPIASFERQPSEITRGQWQAILGTWHRTGHWPRYAGSEPGHPGCLAPSDLLSSH